MDEMVHECEWGALFTVVRRFIVVADGKVDSRKKHAVAQRTVVDSDPDSDTRTCRALGNGNLERSSD